MKNTLFILLLLTGTVARAQMLGPEAFIEQVGQGQLAAAIDGLDNPVPCRRDLQGLVCCAMQVEAERG